MSLTKMTMDAFTYSKKDLREYLSQCDAPIEWKEAVRYVHMLVKDGTVSPRALNIWEFAVYALIRPIKNIQYRRSPDMMISDQSFLDDAICSFYEKSKTETVNVFMNKNMELLSRHVWDTALSTDQKISMCIYQEKIPLTLQERQNFLLQKKSSKLLQEIIANEPFSVFNAHTKLSRFPFCSTLGTLIKYANTPEDFAIMQTDPNLSIFIEKRVDEISELTGQAFDLKLPYDGLIKQNVQLVSNTYFRNVLYFVPRDKAKALEIAIHNMEEHTHLPIIYDYIQTNKEKFFSKDKVKDFVSLLFLSAMQVYNSDNAKILMQELNAEDILYISEFIRTSKIEDAFFENLSQHSTPLHYLILQYWQHEGIINTKKLPDINITSEIEHMCYEFNIVAKLSGTSLNLDHFIATHLNPTKAIVQEFDLF